MKLEGSYTFENASRELVWEMFLDPKVLAKTMPGCEKLEEVGDGEYEGKMKIKVGPVQGVFKGNVQLSNLQRPKSYKMKVNGRGPSGIVNGEGDVRLEEEEGGTVMHYTGDAKVSGRIASVGQRLMDSSAKAITKQSLENLDKQIQARLQAEAGAAAPTEEEEAPAAAEEPEEKEAEAKRIPPAAPAYDPDSVPAPTQTEFALGVAQEMFNDFVPEEQQKFVLAGLALLVVYLLFNWWTNAVARRVAKMIKEEG